MHTQYVYDNNDRLETAGGQTFTYDLNGNTKTVTEDANVTTSMYDQDNRLIAMQIVESGSLVEDITYEYDAGGIRTKKVVNGVETNFLVDQNRDYAQVLVEYTDLNQELAFYVFGDDLLSVTKFDAVGGSDKRWYQHDGMTSVRHLSDATGALTDSYTYAAYGTVLDESGAFENSYQFHGDQRDAETGQVYLRARYYSPSIKRFTQQDTFLGFERTPLSLNKYAFTEGDGGINAIDPSGHFSLGSIGTALNIVGRLAVTSVRTVGTSIIRFANTINNFAKSAYHAGGRAVTGARMALVRAQYDSRVRKLSKIADEMRKNGSKAEDIAKALNRKRRALGRLFKNATDPKTREFVFRRNMQKYGDKWGPTWQYLRKQGKSWEQIAESAAKPNSSIKELIKIFFGR